MKLEFEESDFYSLDMTFAEVIAKALDDFIPYCEETSDSPKYEMKLC